MANQFEVNISPRLLQVLGALEAALEKLPAFEEKLARILAGIEPLREDSGRRHVTKEWYTSSEFAVIVGRAKFTVRQWCLRGRLKAEKGKAGRGKTKEWRISHEELLRYQNEGLLPLKPLSWR